MYAVNKVFPVVRDNIKARGTKFELEMIINQGLNVWRADLVRMGCYHYEDGNNHELTLIDPVTEKAFAPIKLYELMLWIDRSDDEIVSKKTGYSAREFFLLVLTNIACKKDHKEARQTNVDYGNILRDFTEFEHKEWRNIFFDLGTADIRFQGIREVYRKFSNFSGPEDYKKRMHEFDIKLSDFSLTVSNKIQQARK